VSCEKELPKYTNKLLNYKDVAHLGCIWKDNIEWWKVPSAKTLKTDFNEDSVSTKLKEATFRTPEFKRSADSWKGKIYGKRLFSAGGHTFKWE
jgi:hypothetical protein